jgi:hypothetical protein
MNLDQIEDLHTRSQRHGATSEDRESALATIPVLLALVKNLKGDNNTHEGDVKELVRARDHVTGRLSVVFQVEGEGRPLVMDAKAFDVRYPLLKEVAPEPVFHVHKTYSLDAEDEGPKWECRSCRKLFAYEAERFQVRDEVERSLGEWCEECVVARVHKPH